MWIKERIDAEHRKHYKVTGGCDWMKLSEQKILLQFREMIEELHKKKSKNIPEGLKLTCACGKCDLIRFSKEEILSFYSEEEKVE